MFQLNLLHDQRPRTFNIQLQNWIGSVQPPFHVLQVDSVEEEPFGALKVGICKVEVEHEVNTNST